MTSISICIPTYNGAEFLEPCLDSLAQQTWQDFEVVVCDDASSDDTWHILKRYAARDNRFRIYRNPVRLGLVGNWQRCLEKAQGEWTKFLFQDDLLEPDCLSIFADNLDPSHPLIFCRRRFLMDDSLEDSARIHYQSLPSLDTLFPGTTFITPHQLIDTLLVRTRQNFLGEPTTCMIHRSVFERYGNFDEDLVQFCDFEYWIRIGIHEGIAYIPKTLASFRLHSNSTSSTNRLNFRSEYLDELLIWNAWCYHPLYRPLRRRARELGINLKRKLAAQSFWLERYVRELARDDPEPLSQWNQVMKRHRPQLYRNPYIWPLMAKEWLNKHLFWRFQTS